MWNYPSVTKKLSTQGCFQTVFRGSHMDYLKNRKLPPTSWFKFPSDEASFWSNITDYALVGGIVLLLILFITVSVTGYYRERKKRSDALNTYFCCRWLSWSVRPGAERVLCDLLWLGGGFRLNGLCRTRGGATGVPFLFKSSFVNGTFTGKEKQGQKGEKIYMKQRGTYRIKL